MRTINAFTQFVVLVSLPLLLGGNAYPKLRGSINGSFESKEIELQARSNSKTD
jgi:hypothetical protein